MVAKRKSAKKKKVKKVPPPIVLWAPAARPEPPPPPPTRDYQIMTALGTKSGQLVEVRSGDVSTFARCSRDLTVAAGDAVLVLKVNGVWVAVQRLGTASGSAQATVDKIDSSSNYKGITGKLVVSPIETRSHRSGSWRKDTDRVMQGEYGKYGNHVGCAFYGSKLRSLAGATITDARLRVKRMKGGVFAPQPTSLYLVTQATRPAGPPTLGSSNSGPQLAVGKATDTFVIPIAWINAMVNGTAGGIAVYDASGSPYVVFAGRSDWSAAFTLTVSWERS